MHGKLSPPRAPSDSRPAAEILADARRLTESTHRNAVDLLDAPLRHVAGYHVGWWEADGSHGNHRGKALRPAMVLASTSALTAGAGPGPDVWERSTAAAVAVELVHDFSLIHDDIMDNDLRRRHRPTAWSAFGLNQAVLTGDALQALAFRMLTDARSAHVLAVALTELCAGQSQDLAFEQSAEVTPEQSLAMARGKTGALLGAACELGALAGQAGPERAALFGSYGRELGIAFQLIDDLLGLWGSPDTTGKPVGADLAARKKSLPVVAALASDTPAGRQLGEILARAQPLDEDTVRHATHLVDVAGGRAWAQREAGRRERRAADLLLQAVPDEYAARDLHTLAALVTGRDR